MITMFKINIKTGNAAYSDENENITYEGRYALRADLNKIAEDIIVPPVKVERTEKILHKINHNSLCETETYTLINKKH